MHLILILALLWAPGLAGAEFYKYRDANGVLRFTDDISEVPADQRAKLEEYQSVVTPEPAASGSDDQAAEKGTSDRSRGELSAAAKRLEAERAALEKEYQTIVEEDRRIKAAAGDKDNPVDPEAYNEQLKALQQKINAYDVRRQAFQEKAAAFDAELKKAQQ
jgi:hypothetical protein